MKNTEIKVITVGMYLLFAFAIIWLLTASVVQSAPAVRRADHLTCWTDRGGSYGNDYAGPVVIDDYGDVWYDGVHVRIVSTITGVETAVTGAICRRHKNQRIPAGFKPRYR